MSRRSSNPLSKLSWLSVAIVLAGFVYREWQESNAPKTNKKTQQSRTNGSGSNGSREPSRPPVSGGRSSGQDSNEGNLLLGNPSNAGRDADNYLLERKQYSMSYNRSRGGSNWVAWHTDAQDLGDAERGKFQPDPQLPADWRITPADYKGSGFDRGHVCPSGDRTGSRTDNDATFYMSNMLPQTAELNQHVWADCENAVRDIVRQGNEVYQIAGGVGNSGTIADGKVIVPQVCWKVIVVLPEGKNDLSRINANTRIIVIGIPNVKDTRLRNGDWHSYITNLDKIQTATKLDLLSALPTKVRSALGSKIDAEQ
jgi:endonuclease G